MKDLRQERLGRLQREYHRHHPWRLGPGGLFVPHSYAEVKPDALSWWDDVGFILNGRRVIVWWRHPRCVYHDALEELASEQAGEFPFDDWLMKGAIANYRKVGRSRKKSSATPAVRPRRLHANISSAYKLWSRSFPHKALTAMCAPAANASVCPGQPGWIWWRHWRCATNKSLR